MFTGNSGVGKSTLINTIFHKNLMKEGEVSIKTQRGKHTTRHVELIESDDLTIVDTPGFSMLEMFDIKREELVDCFDEMRKLKFDCAFRDCTHIKEECCAIKEAVKNGSIDNGRYSRYVQIYNEIIKK